MKKTLASNVVAILLIGIYASMTFILLYLQAYYPGQYLSDLPVYIAEASGKDILYQFAYPLLFVFTRFIARFCSIQMGMVIAVTILNTVSMCIMIVIFQAYFRKRIAAAPPVINHKTRILASISAFSVFLVSMIFPLTEAYLKGEKSRYLGVFSPNPYHNATYLATRPFAILTFFLFVMLLDEYETKTDWKKHLALAVSFLLTTLTKPSFSLVFAVGGALVVAVRFFKRPAKLWKQTIYMALCFLPAALDLLYQYGGMFGAEIVDGNSIAFGWGKAWGPLAGSIPIAFIKAAAFILIVIACNLKAIRKNTMFRFSLMILFISFLMLGGLYETGDRINDMNFAWGYMHGLFFAMASALLVLLENTINKMQSKWILAIQWFFFLFHLLCGGIYFMILMKGGEFI